MDYPVYVSMRRRGGSKKHQSIMGQYTWTRAPTITVKDLGSIRTTDGLSFSKKYKKFGYVDS